MFSATDYLNPINSLMYVLPHMARSLKGQLICFMDIMKDTGTFYSSVLLALLSLFC